MHLLFDLDGTLTDPREGIIGCFRHALDRLGVEVAPATRLETFIGPPIRDSFRSLCGAERSDAYIESAVSLYRERFSTIGLFENEVYDGIPQALAQLRGSADSMFLATSKPAIYARRIVERFELDRHLDGVYGSELNGRLGDKTELIGHILASENLDPGNCVMIGDRRFDVLGARNNKVRSVGVLWGYGSREELNQAGADSLCAQPVELPTCI